MSRATFKTFRIGLLNGLTKFLNFTSNDNDTFKLERGDGLSIMTIDANGMCKLRIPTFSASLSSIQSIPGAAYTKVVFNSEAWDTNNDFDISNGRLTPKLPGVYNLLSILQCGAGVTGQLVVVVYKNGAFGQILINKVNNETSHGFGGSTLVQANGTDYFEIFLYQNSGGSRDLAVGSIFQGHLVGTL